ncbi:MAG: endolytic transglycosylase MltG [Bdellovibrionales bacterium]|nr:endolytic transglycosylase MltG [Bdellovibrionales bacterium]
MGNTKVFIRYFLYVFLPCLVAFGVFQYLNNIFFLAKEPSARNKKIFVEIAPKLTFSDVCKELEKKGIIRAARNLNLYARFKGQDDPIKPGEYVLSPSMTPKEILARLLSGKVYERQIELLEGVSVWDVGELLEKESLLKAGDFEAALGEPGLLARAGISSASFEGYFAPGTYSFSRPVDPKKVICTFLEQGERNWPPEFSQQADQTRLSRHEVLTLASIIQKTTDRQDERVLVSSVLHNRLNHGMKLESEEALIYGLRDYEGGMLTEEDKQSPSQYNTFTNYGLPPGPICNPGMESIRAALFPEESSYLFYLRNPFGDLEFSATLAEHKAKLAKILTPPGA